MRAARTLTLDSTVTVSFPDLACGPGEVICRIIASATCGSDVHGWYVTRKLPAVLGHEPVGEVVEVGAGVTRVAPGDVVAIHHHVACGACRVCAAGHETLCPQFRATRLDPGGFAEHVRIQPELVADLLPLDGLDPVTATCTEPLACALRAQDRVGLTPRDVLLVVGAGTSGLLHIGAARARGVERVLVAEPRADRRERALEWGAVAFAPGEPVDVAIVTSHHPQAVAAAAAALGPGGRLCAYAPPEPGAPIAVDGAEIFLRELTVTSSWSSGAADWRAALALLAVRRGERRRAGHASLRARRDRRGARRPAGRERAEGGRAALGGAVMGATDVFAFVRAALPAPPARILEVGAGQGELAAALSGAGYEVVAIDPAGAADPHVRPVALLDLEEREGSFDAAVAVLSLHHVEPLEPSLAHLGALVRPGGSLVVDEFDVELFDTDAAAWWCARRRELGQEAPEHPAETAAELRAHLHPVAADPCGPLAGFRADPGRARSLPAPLGARARAPARRGGGDRGRPPARRRRPLHGRPPLNRAVNAGGRSRSGWLPTLTSHSAPNVGSPLPDRTSATFTTLPFGARRSQAPEPGRSTRVDARRARCVRALVAVRRH